MPKASRKQLILETLAHELESNPGDRITTAGLARAVGVSEAALYRHFASKARMFEGLIEFAEETVFARINLILEEEKGTEARCAKVVYLLLGFADRNPGITRVLLGDALVGERERLLERLDFCLCLHGAGVLPGAERADAVAHLAAAADRQRERQRQIHPDSRATRNESARRAVGLSCVKSLVHSGTSGALDSRETHRR